MQGIADRKEPRAVGGVGGKCPVVRGVTCQSSPLSTTVAAAAATTRTRGECLYKNDRFIGRPSARRRTDCRGERDRSTAKCAASRRPYFASAAADTRGWRSGGTMMYRLVSVATHRGRRQRGNCCYCRALPVSVGVHKPRE